MQKELIYPLKGLRPKTPTASLSTEQSPVAAQLQSRASQLLEGQAQPWGCWLIQALDNFPVPASAVSQASTSSLGLTALTVDIYMAHLAYFSQMAAWEIVFSRLLSHVRLRKHKTTSGNRQQCFSGQALEPRAAVLQAPGTPEVLQELGSAQLKARQLFPQQLRSPCTLPPTQGATRLITLAGSPGLC